MTKADVIANAKANNVSAEDLQILENTPMFFKGSALLAKISFDIEVLEVGDTGFYLYLDLDNVLTITDES